MRPLPSLSRLPYYPVTGGIGLLAIVVSGLWWKGTDISLLFENEEAFLSQPWRLVTSALPHVNIIHLAFNLYWLWVFGTLLEEVLGRLATLGVALLFAAGSAAGEFTFFGGGVGLSGVVYGMFGLLWVLSRKDPRFRDAIDRQTIQLFIAWFFACVVMTVTGIMPVGNVAHGVGALLGVLLGLALVTTGRRPRFISGAIVCLMLLLLAGAGFGRPYLNLSASELAYLADKASEENHDREAVRLYRRALTLNGKEGRYWHNLGVAYMRLGKSEDAAAAFEHALALDPGNKTYRSAVEYIRGRLPSD
jgi:GlpG protein